MSLLLAAAEHAHEGGLATEYWELLRSPAHILFELTIEACTAIVTFSLGWLLRGRVIRKHHERYHAKEG